LVFWGVLVLVLVLVLMLMVVVEIHERLGEKMLILLMMVLMLHLLNDYVLIEGQVLMNRYYVLNQKELLFHLMMDLIQCLMEQNLLELVFVLLLILCVSTQVRFVYYLIVELVAFLAVVFVLLQLIF
jgi:hypothetical protein